MTIPAVIAHQVHTGRLKFGRRRPDVLRGGTFNLLYGRNDGKVMGEVTRLLRKHRLDFLAVQEAKDYRWSLDDIPGYRYYTDTSSRGSTQQGILVHSGLHVRNVRYKSYGDGWWLPGGTHRHTPPPFPRLTIDRWLRIGTVHMPNPTVWSRGRLKAPPERIDDYMATARAVRRFHRYPGARVTTGDWNEPKTTVAPWSPAWIALQVKADVVGTGIDWTMGTGVDFLRSWTDREIQEGSDHEPKIFIVRRAA